MRGRGRILLVGFLLLIVLAVCVVMSLQVFRVQEVVVEGCEQRSPVAVVDLAAVNYDQSIFQINFSEIRKNIEQSPYFEVVDIGFILPDKVRIRVHERVERAAILWDGQAVIMDENGYIVEIRENLGDVRVPVVSGMYVKAAEAGKLIESENPVQVSAMYIVLQSLIDQQLSQIVSEINVGEPSDLFMITTEGFMVRLGNFEDMDEKIDTLSKVIPMLVSEGYTSGTINVSTGDSATFLNDGQTPLDLDPAQPPASSAEPEETPSEAPEQSVGDTIEPPPQ